LKKKREIEERKGIKDKERRFYGFGEE